MFSGLVGAGVGAPVWLVELSQRSFTATWMEGPYGAGEAHLRDVQWLHIHGGDDGGGCYLCDFVAGQELVAEFLPELHLDIILLDQ